MTQKYEKIPPDHGHLPGEIQGTRHNIAGVLDGKMFDFSNPLDQATIAETLKKIDDTFMDFLSQAREIFLAGFNNPSLDVSKKLADDSPGSYVTAADRAIEGRFRSWVQENFPDHSIFGEEEGRKEEQETLDWRLDPIDGTKNFAKGDSNSSIVVALCYKGVPIFAAVDLPNHRETYIARIDRGVEKNGQPIPHASPHSFRAVVNAFRNEARKQEAIGELDLNPDAVYTKTSTLCEVIDVINSVANVGVWCEAGEHEWPAAVLLARENGNVVWQLDKQDSFDLTSNGPRDFAIALDEETFEAVHDKIHSPVSP